MPKALNKSLDNVLTKNSVSAYHFEKASHRAQEPDLNYLTPEERAKMIVAKRKTMEKAAKNLDFLEAARLRDEIKALQLTGDAK